jgi:hypothetical protein
MLGLELGFGVCYCPASVVLLDGSLVEEQIVYLLLLVVIHIIVTPKQRPAYRAHIPAFFPGTGN